MANRQRDTAKEAFWREALARHAASGLSVRAFCHQEQVTESSFYAWRREIATRDNKKPPSRVKRKQPRTSVRRQSTNGAAPPAFVPAVIRDTAPRDAIRRNGAKQEASLTIELSSGVKLHASDSVPATRLAELVHALEARENTQPRGER